MTSSWMSNKAKLPEFGPKSIRLAVIPHIRHVETDYDMLLARGYGRREAQPAAEAPVIRVLVRWISPATSATSGKISEWPNWYKDTLVYAYLGRGLALKLPSEPYWATK